MVLAFGRIQSWFNPTNIQQRVYTECSSIHNPIQCPWEMWLSVDLEYWLLVKISKLN